MSETPVDPVAELFAAALDASPLSQNKAAAKAGMSGTRWRQIATGWEQVKGKRYPTPRLPARVAAMAEAVDISPAELRAVGLDEAAERLERRLARHGETSPGQDRAREIVERYTPAEIVDAAAQVLDQQREERQG